MIYRNTADSVIWDIFPENFTENGSFEKLIEMWKSGSFSSLVMQEILRVRPFLRAWGDLLFKTTGTSADDLEHLFLKAPELSGVLYCSHSTVLSENFFVPAPQKITHPTDRVIAQEALQRLPSAKDLTFSFPRKYEFAGFYNSWGFVRIERKDDEGNGAGVLLSVVTLDGEVLDLLKKMQCEPLVNLYNQSWNGAIHDYIHHLALYTNPSFGIGKRSPMSLVNLHREVDQWGEDMVDTFNYEYWAHRTHRLVTGNCPEVKPEQIIQDAKEYFFQTSQLQDRMLKSGYERAYVQKVGEYLGSIYLWPLHILVHPYGEVMQKVGESIELLDLPEKKDLLMEAGTLLSGKYFPQDPRLQEKIFAKLQTKVLGGSREEVKNFLIALSQLDEHPLLKGLAIALKSLKICDEKIPFPKQEWLRFKVAITVQRGMYNCWEHSYPVIFQKQVTDPLIVFSKIFQIVQNTLSQYRKQRHSYELSGISP